jgi:hypothetical protein
MARGDKLAHINKVINDFKRGKFIDYFTIANYNNYSYSSILRYIYGLIKSRKKANSFYY